MKPMTLKTPSECCGSPTLLWSKEKGNFICPCGKMVVNAQGLPVKRFVSFTRALTAQHKDKRLVAFNKGNTRPVLKKSRFDEHGRFK